MEVAFCRKVARGNYSGWGETHDPHVWKTHRGGGRLSNGERLSAGESAPRKRGFKPLAVVAAGVLALTVGVGVAQAAGADPIGAIARAVGIESRALDDHVLTDTVSPSGTTINLFDYWITERDDDDSALKGNNPDYTDAVTGRTGINGNNRQLQFTPGDGQNIKYDAINNWTGAPTDLSDPEKGIQPRTGMVKSTLDGGYPSLQRNTSIGISKDESLAYLFDASNIAGKKSFFGTTGLLRQVDGYYEYNSVDNFASFDEKTNSFKVYDQGALYQNNKDFAESAKGQFFPFYTADQVFTEGRNGLEAKKIDSKGRDTNRNRAIPATNHYFGLSMSSRFVQPKGGETNSGDNMVFEFSGDDDVWVFVDDVLVGDLGGNHSAASLKIDFATGNIVINEGTSKVARTTLRKCFADAGRKATWNDKGTTFADDTQHTLNFFYLERGNADSNMRLKFNLVTIPVSEVYKVDQDGDPVADAYFALYAAEEGAEGEWIKKSDDIIADGRTDPTGQLLLTSKATREVLTFKDLVEDYGTKKFILTETFAPAGYGSNLSQTGNSVYLEYIEIADENSPTIKSGIVVDRGGTDADSFIWQNGAFTSTKETVTATEPINYVGEGGAVSEDDLKNGLLFAVVLKRDKTAGGDPATDTWHAVYGDPLDGYEIQDGAGIDDVIAAAKADGANASILRLNSSGQYQTEIENLPGDINKYYFVTSNKNDAEYAVGFYFAKGVKSLDQANPGNTKRVNGDKFTREFSARVNVSNTFNRLYVQKDDGTVNADGTRNYIAGAEFTLYADNEANITTGEDGKPALRPNAVAYDTVTTVDKLTDEKVAKLEGAAVFPSSEKGVLENGTYYLKETKAPEGYKISDALIKVIVSDEGVFADAGSDKDGVRTSVGVGRLMKTMAQFGAANEINSTLTYIKGSLQTATEEDGKLAWGAASTDAAKVLNLSYAANDALLEYGPATEGGPVAIESETGWNRLLIQQDAVPADTTVTGNRTELGDRVLNALFSGSMSVIVSDERVASLEIKKTVQKENGLAPNSDTLFEFQFDLPYGGGKTYMARVFDKDGKAVEEDGKALEYTLSERNRIISIKADQTIKVYGLKEGDSYTVTELTENGTKPAGFTLVGRKQGGADYKKETPGADIKGTVAAISPDEATPTANKLEFINEYGVTPVDLPADATFGVKKVLTTTPENRAWEDGDQFTINLTGKEGAPLPEGVNGGTYTVTLTKKQQEYTFGDPSNEDTKITFTKSGIYEYTISEVTGSKPGMTYSDAEYTVAVDVRDKGDGTLYVAKVTMKQTHADAEDDESISEAKPKTICEISWVDESGKLLNEPKVTPEDGELVATITNSYTEKTQSVAIIPHKTFANDTGSDYPFASAGFKAMLKAEAVDGDTTKAGEVPRPSGELDNNGWITHEFSSSDQNATFGAIQFNSDEHMGHSYTYLVKEYIPDGVDTNNVLNGMQYDPSVYEVTYTVDDELDNKGNLQVSVSWKKGETQLDSPTNGELTVRPEFTNTYSVTSVGAVSPQAQKTLKGRSWRTDDSFTFTLKAAQGTKTEGIQNWETLNKKVTLTGKDASTKNPVQFYFATEEKDGQQVPAQLIFTKAGTYTFNIKETTKGEAATNAEKKGLKLDDHTATVTYVVTDLVDGKHTGTLKVTGPTCTNIGAPSLDDQERADIAAFTNEYIATGNNGEGVNLTKVLHGKNMQPGRFSFTINNVTSGEPGTHVDAVNCDGNVGAGETWTRSGLLKLNFNQDDLGKTYVYSVAEDDVDGEHPGYVYDTKCKGTAYVYVTVKAKSGNEGQLYADMVVVKGEGAKRDYTQDELAKLESTADLYVQRYDSSQEVSDSNKVATVPFENTYAANFDYTANGGLDLGKTFKSLTDTGTASSVFYFKVTPQNTIVTDEDEETTTTITTAEDAAEKLGLTVGGSSFQVGPVSLGNTASTSVLPTGENNHVVFTQADGGKTYTYQVVEVTPEGETPKDNTPTGYAYDTNTYTVTISVKDNNNGTLTVTTTVAKPDGNGGQKTVSWAKVTTSDAAGDTQNKVATVPFENTYTTTSAAADLAVKKQISGRAETTKEFGFTLKATVGDAAKDILSSIDAINGEDIVDKDGNKITLGADGVITSDAKTFGKIEESRPQEVKLTSLKFNKVGTYQFVVTENLKSDDNTKKDGVQNDGWTMDERLHTVTVTVADENSQLKAKMTWDANNGEDTFNNTYGATVAYSGINVTKTLTGKTLRAGDFEFEIKGVAGPIDTGATEAEANAKLVDEKDKKFSNDEPDNSGKASMSKLSGIAFDEEDAGKTFVYEVKETKGGSPKATVEKPNGYTNDERTYVVSIKVNDDGKGNLSTVTTVKVKDAEGEGVAYPNDKATVAEVPFENSYRRSGSLGGSAKVKIEADKTLTGRDMKKDEFTFEVTAKKNGSSAGVVTTGKNAEADDGKPGDIKFDEIIYSNLSSGAAGFPDGAVSLPEAEESGLATKGTVTEGGKTKDTYTFTYTVSEKTAGLPDGVKPVEGKTSFDITVVVTDNNDGTLSAVVKYPNNAGKLSFENKMDKSKTIGTAEKPTVDIDGKQLSVGDQYTYTIKWMNNAVDEQGNATVADITITDALPNGTKFVSATPANTYSVSGQTVTWSLGSQDANASGTVTVTVEITNDAVTTIDNKATINIGEHHYDTNTVTNTVPKKEVTGAETDGSVQVGKELTYTISYKNDSSETADVIITDVIPTGTEYVDKSAGEGVYDAAAKKITWTVKGVEAGKTGTVSFEVRVTEDAVTTVENQATIKVGEDGPEVKTNKVTNEVKTGNLTISKMVKSSDAGVTAPDKEFEFKVVLKDAKNKELTKEYAYTITSNGVAGESKAVKSGETIRLRDGQSATITGLSEGATWQVTETPVTGYNSSVKDNSGDTGDGAGTIDADNASTVTVTNTYTPDKGTLSGETGLNVSKTLTGRDSKENEKFTFKLTAGTNNAGDGVETPMPNEATIEISDLKSDEAKTNSFGNITFSKTGTYNYTIEETSKSGDENLKMSTAKYDVVVMVSDTNNDGKLEVSANMTKVASTGTEAEQVTTGDNGKLTANFVNVYTPAPQPEKDVLANDGEGNPTTSVNGKLVGVGDELTYTIKWTNDAVDDKGEAVAADVVITDAAPAGTELVKDSAKFDTEVSEDSKVSVAKNGAITWTIRDAAANASGTVSFKVKVTEDAVKKDSIKNQATVQVGKNDPKQSTEVENDFPKKSVTTQNPAGSVKVGDILTYTVEWANTTGETADVVVSDTFMAGLELLTGNGDYEVAGADGKEVQFETKSGSDVDGPSTTTAIVTIKGTDKDAKGTVVFKARVTEDALSVDSITNKATITVGDKSSVTNTITTPAPGKGNLAVSKTVTAGENGVIDGNKSFDFTVEAKDAAGNALNGAYGDLTFENGEVTFQLKSGESKQMTALPEGAVYTVTETKADGYTTTIDAGNSGATVNHEKREATGTIKDGDNGTIAYTNVYGSEVPTGKPIKVDGLLIKKFTGRTWNDSDVFKFKVEAEDGVPIPDGVGDDGTVTVKGNGVGETQPINLGAIHFDFDDIKDVKPGSDGKRTKEFIYTISEVVPRDDKLPGVEYDNHQARLIVTLTDDGKGNLTAESKIAAVTRAENSTFHNVYTSKVDYTAVAGIQLQKTLTGRDMTAGQFAFTLSNFSEGAQEKLGLSGEGDAYKVTAAEAGEASIIDLFSGRKLEFTNKDTGKTYSFDVTETKVGGDGYTNDTVSRHVEIAVTYDKASGVLTVTTTVTNAKTKEVVARTEVTSETKEGDRQVAVIPFTNSYEASTENDRGTAAAIEAAKTLTGRPLKDGEFSFTLTGPGLDDAGKTVKNKGGEVSFGTFNYTAAELEEWANADNGQVERTEVDGKRAWKLSYNASESTDGFGDKGLTAERQNFYVTVTVVDNGDGSLTASVAYPAENEGGNVFKNTYNADEIKLSLSGKKVLDHTDKLKPNSIEDKFTFTLTDEAGEKLAEAKNDADGNISFKDVLTYTLDSFNKEFGAAEDEGVERSHTYTYHVEESGIVPGVTNDSESKIIEVKVTDDGRGHLTAEVVKKDGQTLDFSFTNTYKVEPIISTITDQLEIGKTIDGREMQAGEFDFVMVDAAGNTVAGGDNDEPGASSKVTFTPIKFTEPGEHDYTVREVNSGKGGVSYDGISYQAHASVKDNGDGTLSVTWTFSKGDNSAGDESTTGGIVFKNTYTTKPTSISFDALKVLTGRDLRDGEFTFQLREGDNVLQTVKNAADGTAAFGPIEYAEAGNHDYTIVEVKGDDANINYDGTVYHVYVDVVDNGKGALEATVTITDEEGNKVPAIFHNSYQAPPTPPDPDKPDPDPDPKPDPDPDPDPKPDPTPDPDPDPNPGPDPDKPVKPSEPDNPAKPDKPELPQTGDSAPSPIALGAMATAGVGLIGCGAVLAKRSRRK